MRSYNVSIRFVVNREMVTKNQKEAIQKANEAMKKDAINRMLNSSMITDDAIWTFDLYGYKVS